ncbi:transposase [Roseovarius sp. D0-M9]
MKAHWDGILNGFDSRLSNGGVEAINGLIQAAKPKQSVPCTRCR